MKFRACLAIAGSCLLLASSPVSAASCGNDGRGFDAWLENFKGRARASGISQATIDRALSGVKYDTAVIRRDRSQKSFKLSFEEFYKRRVGSYLMSRARTQMKRHAGLFASIEKRYGVPKEILVSIWGLETSFG